MNIAVAHKFAAAETYEDQGLPIHGFFEEHRDALRNAARLLGGREGINLVDEIVDALSGEHDLPRRTIEFLHDLDDLLSLEHVGDSDRTESGYFAAIDIYDPIVDEICLLTDGLRTAIAALPEHQRLLSKGSCSKGSNHASQSQTPIAGPLAFVPRGKGDAK